MRTKVKNTAIITLAALALAIALIFAALCSPRSAAADKGVVSASAASAVVDGDSILSDGDVEEQLTQAPEGYTAIGGDSGNGFSAVRSAPSGNYILMGDITVSSLDTTTAFSGILDGNGYTITVNAEINTTGSDLSAGGLFHTLTGTVKNVRINVEKFQLGIGSSGDNHFAGMVAAIINGGTVENAYITLQYDPVTTTADSAGTSCDFYMYAYSSLGSGVLILGGVAGNTRGNAVISNVTVDNQSTGSYGFGVAGWQTNGSWISNTTLNHVVGGFIGRVGFGETNMATTLTNVTLTGADDAKFILYNEASSGNRTKKGYGGGLCGWIDSSTTLYVDGLIYDYPGELDDNLVNTNMSDGKTYFGRITGLTEGSYSMSNVFYKSFNSSDSDSTYNNPSSLTWLDGGVQSAGGVVIYQDTTELAFDKTREGHVIISGAYSSVMGESDLIFGARIGSSIAPLYDSLIVSSEAEKQTGLYVSAQTGSVSFGDGNTNSVLEWVNPYYGTAQYNSDSRVTASDEGTTAQYTYDYSQAQIYLDTYNGGSVVTSALGYGYTYDGAAVNVGEYEFTLNSEYVYETRDGTKYLADETGGGFADISNLAESIIVTVKPAVVTGTVSGALTVAYGESLSSVASGLVLDLQNTYADFAGVAGLDITATLQGGSGETYNTSSGAGSVFDISVASISPNYDMSGVTSSATVTVAKRQVTGYVTVPSGAVYDGQAHEAGFFAYSGSAANNDDISKLLTYTYVGENGAAEPINAGSYTVSAAFAKDANYEFAASEDNVTSTASFEIAKADAVWDVEKNQFGYMGGDFSVSWNISGVNEQDSLQLREQVQAAWAEGSAPAAEGTYTYELTFAGNENYNASSVSVQYSVQKAQVSLFISAEADIDIEYGEEIDIKALGGGVFTVNGVKVTVTARVSLGAGVDIGDIDIALSANASSGSGVGEYMLTAYAENGENYDVMAPAVIGFDIVPKQAKISAAEGAVTSKVYDGLPAENIQSLFEDISGEGLIITIRNAQGEAVESIVNAGEYTVSAAYASANYSGSGSVVFAVEKADQKPVILSAVRTGSGAEIVIEGGNAGVEYSLDKGVNWAKLPENGKINLSLEEKMSIIFRYVETDNILGVATAQSEVALTYDALEENMDALPEELTFSDMDSWNQMSGLAQLALSGEKSESFDGKVSKYGAQAEQLKAQAANAVENAFSAAGALTSGTVEDTGDNQGSLLWLVITLAVLVAAELVAAAVLTAKLSRDKKRGKKAFGAMLFLMGAAVYEIALVAVFAVVAVALAVYIGIACARIVKNKKQAAGAETEEDDEQDEEQA